MKTSIYAFLTEKWLEENVDGLKSVFMDRKNQATYEAMVDALGSDSICDEVILERLYSRISESPISYSNPGISGKNLVSAVDRVNRT